MIWAFNVAHDHRLCGHRRSEKSLLSLKSFFWPAVCKWVRTIAKSCLNRQKNQETWNDQNTAPNEKRGEEVPYPIQTIHLDHKRRFNSMSDGKHYCFVVLDAFSRFIQVYPVKSIDATPTTEAMCTFKTSFEIPQKLVFDRVASLMNTDIFIFILELVKTHFPGTTWSPWTTNGKVEIQNEHFIVASVATHLTLEIIGPNWLVKLLWHTIIQ